MITVTQWLIVGSKKSSFVHVKRYEMDGACHPAEAEVNIFVPYIHHSHLAVSNEDRLSDRDFFDL